MRSWRKRFGHGGFVAPTTSRRLGVCQSSRDRANNRTGRVRCIAWISSRHLEAAGIAGPVGWHTLRHSFGTLMKANGEDVKTIQELLRHANFKVTMDVYTQSCNGDQA